jgi:cytochrome b561
MDLLDFKTSIISILLKWIIPLVFLFGACLFFRARKNFSGELKLFVSSLALAGLFGFIAHALRLSGDYMKFWKWGESIGYLVFVALNIYCAWRAAGPLVNYVKKLYSDMQGK